MLAIRAKFDGKKVVLPRKMRRPAPGDVIVVFTGSRADQRDRLDWLKAQERALTKVWDNDEDAVYDSL